MLLQCHEVVALICKPWSLGMRASFTTSGSVVGAIINTHRNSMKQHCIVLVVPECSKGVSFLGKRSAWRQIRPRLGFSQDSVTVLVVSLECFHNQRKEFASNQDKSSDQERIKRWRHCWMMRYWWNIDIGLIIVKPPQKRLSMKTLSGLFILIHPHHKIHKSIVWHSKALAGGKGGNVENTNSEN